MADDAEAQRAELGLEGRWVDGVLAPNPSYVLTRFVVLRLLGAVYFVAFLVAARQLVPLVGEDGILPASRLLGRVGFRHLPTLFAVTGASDAALLAVSWIGAALSAAVALGLTNAVVMIVLWALYLSVVHVGQIFYGYGWEIQLLETGVLAAFLCPVRGVHPFPRSPPPVFALWLLRWLVFRIMLGAGLIKLRGDACWTDLTCLEHHYETQPIPGPLSAMFHALPSGVHRAGVAVNHLVEVVAPFFAFWPAAARRIAGALFVAFQLTLVLSGNLAFLNWLTIVPALACFDDGLLRRVLPARLVAFAERRTTSPQPTATALWASGAWMLVVAALSLSPLSNMLSPRQAMNRSFDRLHLVNTYGAFGSVGKVRYEVVLAGTGADVPDASAEWKEYVLPCKPGPIDRTPCWITPYHRRLDWQMWFLQFSPAEQNPWFVSLLDQLLAGSRGPSPLFEVDPFPDRPPRWIKADVYVYRFAKEGVWERSWHAPYVRPLERGDPELQRLLDAMGLRRREEP